MLIEEQNEGDIIDMRGHTILFSSEAIQCVTQSLELSQLAVVRTTNSRHHIKSIGYNIDNQHHQYQGSQPTDPLVRHLARSKNKQKEAL